MTSPVIFQALSWYAEDIVIEEDDVQQAKYFIKVFGRDQKGKSVSMTVTDFMPFFFIKLDKDWCNGKVVAYKKLVEKVLDNMKYALYSEESKDFWGFTNNTKFMYYKLAFNSLKDMRAASAMLSRSKMPIGYGEKPKPYKFKLYESNIEPYLRFIHGQGIQPSGWIKVKRGYATSTDIMETHCALDIEAKYTLVKPYACDETAPFIVASFDIECTSTGGEFPVPVKDYKHMSSQLYDLYMNLEKKGASDYSKKTALIAALLHALMVDPSDEYAKSISKVEIKRTKTSPMSESYKKQIRERAESSVDDIVACILAKGIVASREACINTLANTMVTRFKFPPLSGDRIIQIGTTFHTYGSRDCFYKHIVTLGSCTELDGVDVIACDSEDKLLTTWRDMMCKMDPDIVTGYNIFGFDFDYMYQRAQELKVEKELVKISRLKGKVSEFKEQRLSSSALGDNLLKYINMEGRVLIDLMKVVQRDHKLDSYKLDNVASHFMGMNKNDVSPQEIFSLQLGDANDRAKIAAYCIQDCALCNYLVMKLEIVANNMGMSNVCLVPMEYIFMRGQGIKIFSLVMNECTQNGFKIPVMKREVSVKKEDVYKVLEALNTIPPTAALLTKAEDAVKLVLKDVKSATSLDYYKPSAIAAAAIAIGLKTMDMAVEYTHVQGVFAYLQDKEFVLTQSEVNKVLKAINPEIVEEEDGYEGAIVLDPETSIYIEDPVAVLDYASLYPSSMISENLSHDCIVLDPKYDNLPGIKYLDIVYDQFDAAKQKVGERACRYVDGEKGLIPRILMKLLAARKSTRKKMVQVVFQDMTGWLNGSTFVSASDGSKWPDVSEDQVTPAFNEFQIAVLDGLQNAYKVTANSLYGQIGARTSQIYLKDIAACTTATGRKMIMMAKEFLETKYLARVIYGDTDSIFVTFPGILAKGHAKIMPSIERAIAASDEFKKLIKAPHDLEYEKTFWPFILLSKKKYVGNLYEKDDRNYKQKSMGIVLKRRDNAPVVKDIYGGCIGKILEEQDIAASVQFLRSSLEELVSGSTPLDKLVITKSLKTDYKDPTRIAHKVLADRIAERDPGNKPQSNDRIPYVYVQTPPSSTKMLQGEKIETPTFIKANNLVPDYAFYITNQIMKPLLQMYALVVEQLPGYCQPINSFDRIKRDMMLDLKGNELKVADKMQTLREMLVKEILFDPVISRVNKTQVKQTMVAKKYCPVPVDPLAIVVKKPRAKKVVDPNAPVPVRKPRAKKVVDPNAPTPVRKSRAKAIVIDELVDAGTCPGPGPLTRAKKAIV